MNQLYTELLPDDPTEIQYPVHINYDGIEYLTSIIKTKAWHLKYIDVDLEDSETILEDGANVSFTIKLDIRKLLGEEDYPFRVGIQADTLKSELIKISETRYKCKVFSLAEGVNNVSIDILPSRIIGLLGPNGAPCKQGKESSLGLVISFFYPTAR